MAHIWGKKSIDAGGTFSPFYMTGLGQNLQFEPIFQQVQHDIQHLRQVEHV